MENSQPLATESFSYSWLTDKQPPSSDGLTNNLRPTSSRVEDEENFNFDVPVITSPSDLVHADEIFSEGQIKPVYVDASKANKSLKTSASVPASPTPLHTSRSSPFHADRNRHYILGKWRRSSKRILQKCFGFVRPLCKRIGCSRKSRRVDDLERKVFEVQSLSNSLEASPRPSSAYSVVECGDFMKTDDGFDFYHENVRNWRSSSSTNIVLSPSRYSNVDWCDAENSIHEAILYCKRSIEK